MIATIRSTLGQKNAVLAWVGLLLLPLVLMACGGEPTATPNPTTVAPTTIPTTRPATTAAATTIVATTPATTAAPTATPIPIATTAVPTTAPATPAIAAKPSPNILMKDFIGVNQDYKLYEDSTEKDFAKVSKWLRDYAKWNCLQPGEKDYGGLDGKSGCGTAPDFFNYNAFYKNMQAAGINVLHVTELSPGYANWSGENDDLPPVQKQGQGQKPDDFLKHAQYIYQLAAMYGNNKNVPTANIAAPGQKIGQNFIQAIENWNEPDGWWKGDGEFSKEQFYNMLVADYDGDGGRLPKAGAKQADPNMKVVMGGLATTDMSYLYGLLEFANKNGKKIPMDALNFHEYASDGKTGVTPEQAKFGDNMLRAARWRDNNAPGAELWVTEFGWDTVKRGNEHSKVYAGEQNQANWILRGLVMYRAAGVDKAFVFLYNDDEENSPDLYESSGMVSLRDNKKKPAYYYLATMQEMVGDMYLERQISTGKDDVRAYLFRNPNGTNGTFAVWKTSGDGSKIDDFTLALPAGVSKSCTAVVPSKVSLNAARTTLTVTDGKIKLPVSETMTFVTCDSVGNAPGAAYLPFAQAEPALGQNSRISLSTANVFETTAAATDPDNGITVAALTDEQQLMPDDPQATAPKTSWYALTPKDSFGLDLLKGFNLGRLDWFNSGGTGTFEVFSAPPGGYGKWQPLTTITNDGANYGKWASVQLSANNVQYLRFVPKGEAQLGEIALYSQGATPLVQGNAPAKSSAKATTTAAGSNTSAPSTPAGSNTSAPTTPGAGSGTGSAASFTAIGTPPPANGAVLQEASAKEKRLAITSATASKGDIRSAFDGDTKTAWQVEGKVDYAQFSLALDGVHTVEKLRYFITETDKAPNTTVEYSEDGQKWTPLNTAKGINTGKDYGWNELEANVKARYFRFIIKNMPDSTGDPLYELGFYGEVQVIGS